MVPVLLSLEHQPEYRRTGIGMFPEIVIADHPCHFGSNRIFRCDVAGNDPGAADRGIDVEEVDYLLDLPDLLVTPAVVVPPLHLPAVLFCLCRDGLRLAVVPEIRDREQVAFPLAGRHKGEERGKFSHRTPDGEDAVRTKLHPVDSIRSHGIEVIVRQVDYMCSAAFYRVCKSGIILTSIRERHWLILSSRHIKKNGNERGKDGHGPGEEQIIY